MHEVTLLINIAVALVFAFFSGLIGEKEEIEAVERLLSESASESESSHTGVEWET